MSATQGGKDLLCHCLAPGSTEDDAQDAPEQVPVLQEVDKRGGVPAMTPVKQLEQIAAESFGKILTVFLEAEDHITNVRNRVMHVLSDDLSLKLITKADRPVIALPRVGPSQ